MFNGYLLLLRMFLFPVSNWNLPFVSPTSMLVVFRFAQNVFDAQLHCQYYTVPLRSLESPSGFSISARVNFRLVFWLPKFENLKEINADLISSSKLNCLFAEFFWSFFLRGVYRKRMHTKYGITASAPMLSYEKTLKFNMLFSPPIFKLGHLNFNWW